MTVRVVKWRKWVGLARRPVVRKQLDCRYVRRDQWQRSALIARKLTAPARWRLAGGAVSHLSVSIDFDVAEAVTQPDVDRYVSGQRRTHYADESVIARPTQYSFNGDEMTVETIALLRVQHRLPASPAYLTRSLSIACLNRQLMHSTVIPQKRCSRTHVTVACYSCSITGGQQIPVNTRSINGEWIPQLPHFGRKGKILKQLQRTSKKNACLFCMDHFFSEDGFSCMFCTIKCVIIDLKMHQNGFGGRAPKVWT